MCLPDDAIALRGCRWRPYRKVNAHPALQPAAPGDLGHMAIALHRLLTNEERSCADRSAVMATLPAG